MAKGGTPFWSDQVERCTVDPKIQDVTSAQWDALGEHVVVQFESVADTGRISAGRHLALTAPAAAALFLLLSKVFADTDTTTAPAPAADV